jgi:hypothetical protein
MLFLGCYGGVGLLGYATDGACRLISALDVDVTFCRQQPACQNLLRDKSDRCLTYSRAGQVAL